MENEKFFKKWGTVGAVILVCIAIGILLGIIGIQKNTIQAKNEKIVELEDFIIHVKLESEKDISALRIEYEKIKQEVEIEIENLPAAAVVIRFLTDAEIMERTTFTDGIAEQIVKHSIQFFKGMGIQFTAIYRPDLE